MIKSLLLAPRTFFRRRRGRLDGVRAAGIGLLLSLATTAALAAALRGVANRIDGTVAVDNPARPPAAFCENGVASRMPLSGCDEPATVERAVGSLLWEATTEVLPFLFLALAIGGPIVGLLLYAGARLAGGDGSLGATLEVVAWAYVPTLVGAAVAGVLLVAFAGRHDLSAGDPDQLAAQFEALTSGTSGLVLGAVRLATTAWEVVVWAAGLSVVHDVPRRAAYAVAGSVGLLFLVLGGL